MRRNRRAVMDRARRVGGGELLERTQHPGIAGIEDERSSLVSGTVSQLAEQSRKYGTRVGRFHEASFREAMRRFYDSHFFPCLICSASAMMRPSKELPDAVQSSVRRGAGNRRHGDGIVSQMYLNGTAWAQPLPYTFTKITDSVVTPGLGGVSCVGMNDLGTVVVRLNNQQLHRGRDEASFALVTASTFSLCPSINDSDEIAYTTGGPAGSTILVKNADGNVTTLASSTTPPSLYGPNTHFPSLNNIGRAVYVADGEARSPSHRSERLSRQPTP